MLDHSHLCKLDRMSKWVLRLSIGCYNSHGSNQLCCPTETANHLIRLAQLSDTLLRSVSNSHWPPNSGKPHMYPQWCKCVSSPRPCNTPESSQLVVTARCSTSPHHTNSRSAPDDSLPHPNRDCQSYIRGSWPNYKPSAIDCNSPDSRPCKTPTPSRLLWGWHRSR